MTWHYALSDLFIPPLGCAWLALGALAVAPRLRRKRGAAVGVAGASLVVLLVLATPAVATRLLISLESGVTTAALPGAPPQAIVVLSGDATRTTSGYQVGPLTLERLCAGAELYRRTKLPVLVSGGPIGYGGASFAPLMARVLRGAFEVPVRWQEARSLTTWENAEYSAAILRPLGIRSVYVVTNAWHERRALFAFRHFGLTAIAAPGAFDATGPASDFIPSAKGFTHSFYALHEWLGLLAYHVRAWFSGPPANSAA